jgi:hypothetical protein
MSENNHIQKPFLLSQRITQVCILIFAGIATFSGTLQMYLGEPHTTAQLDNIHRFLSGVYLSCGIISLWTALTIRHQNTLIYLIALGIFLGGTGRLISMTIVGLPEPRALWLAYVIGEITLPIIIIVSHIITNRNLNARD